MTESFKNKVNKIIEYCRTQADIYNNYQMGSKILINSIYGALGFSGFYFFNKDLAESVTKQGKNVILYAEGLINKWAQKVWLKDKRTHELMGIKIKDNKPIEKGITVYIDTDSLAGDSLINIENEIISIEVANKKYMFKPNDKIKICRNGIEMEVIASDIQENDLIDL